MYINNQLTAKLHYQLLYCEYCKFACEWPNWQNCWHFIDIHANSIITTKVPIVVTKLLHFQCNEWLKLVSKNGVTSWHHGGSQDS